MSSFKPNAVAYHYHVTGFTVYGENTYSPKIAVGVSVIDFLDQGLISPIRSEASSTHGRVEQNIAVVRILFPPKTQLRKDDRVDVYGVSLQISGFWPTNDLFGKIQHQVALLKRYQIEDPVSLDKW